MISSLNLTTEAVWAEFIFGPLNWRIVDTTKSIFSEYDRNTADPFCVTAGRCSPVKICVFLLFLMRKLVKYIRQPSFSANFKYLICLIYENEPHYPEH